jgi:HSP20 family protein
MNEVVIRNGHEAPAASSEVTYTPRFDAWENENEFVLSGDLPGVAPENLQLHYENRELVIQASVAPRTPGGQMFRQEYGVGDFYRSFAIGKEIDEAAISAELRDGVLTVRLPKQPELRRRRIEVKTA